jgi:glycosyltransferase involved in cell wall biosynthesis
MTIPISVIIPVYRNSHFLNDSLKSLKLQTFKKFEIIIVNDGSPEEIKIRRIFKKYQKKLNIKYISYKKNKGVSYALNTGIKRSKGKYISWLSHDDYFHPKKFELQINFAKFNQKILTLTGFYLIRENKDILKKNLYKNFKFKLKYQILIKDNLNLCTALIPRKFFQEVGYFDEKLKHVQDYELMYRIFQKYEVKIINKPLFFSRVHNGQTSFVENSEAQNEKEKFLISKIKHIKKVFEKSNIYLKIYIIFFLRVKNLKAINEELNLIIKNQNIFFTLILKIIFLMSGLYFSAKK